MKLLLLISAMAALSAGCGKSDDSSSSSDGGGGDSGKIAKTVEGDQPWDDLSKPYLDDKKLDNFMASLKDKDGPFDAVKKGNVTAFNAGGRYQEFEAAARRHGFKSGEEYLGVWMRIGAANTVVMQQETNESMIKMNEENLKTQQEMLKQPDLTPEARQAIEETIKSSRESIEALKKSNIEGANADDVATFKKHRTAFEEAMKDWNK